MKRSKFIPIFLVLMLAACTAIPATEPVVFLKGLLQIALAWRVFWQSGHSPIL